VNYSNQAGWVNHSKKQLLYWCYKGCVRLLFWWFCFYFMSFKYSCGSMSLPIIILSLSNK
jgi:hypothetical protein